MGGGRNRKRKIFFLKKIQICVDFFLENRFRLHHHSSRTDSDMSMYRYRTQLKDIYIYIYIVVVKFIDRSATGGGKACRLLYYLPWIPRDSASGFSAKPFFFSIADLRTLVTTTVVMDHTHSGFFRTKSKKKNEWKKTSRCSTCAMIRELQLSVPFILNRTSNWLIFINF